MRHTILHAAFALAAAAAAFAPPAGAEGRYWGADVGAAFGSGVESTRTNVGVPTNCDQWLTPAATLPDGRTVPLPLSDPYCGGGPRPLPARAVSFDLDVGAFVGLCAGIGRGPWRFEIEAFHRSQGGEKRPLVVPGDDKQVEFVERSEEIGKASASGLFANVHYEFAPDRRFAPSLGVGLGALRVGLDYEATSIRNPDPAALLALQRNPNAAGTVSRADAALTDTLFGYQVVAGVDYALREGRAFTVKLRYVDAFGEFADGGKPWRPLRNHESTVAPGGAPIHYGIEAGELGFWAISAGLRFAFD